MGQTATAYDPADVDLMRTCPGCGEGPLIDGPETVFDELMNRYWHTRCWKRVCEMLGERPLKRGDHFYG